jgi:predicted nucleic acid-binding protein
VAVILPDTRVLVAALCDWHEHHAVAAPPLAAALRTRTVVVAGSVLAEAYAVLTRLPSPHWLSPASARSLLSANLEGARTVTLEGAGYGSCLTAAAEQQIAGGRTYDAVVVACALRAHAGRILTLNRRDFEPLVPPNLIDRRKRSSRWQPRSSGAALSEPASLS